MRSGMGNRFLIFIIIFLFLIATLMALIPQIINTAWGTRQTTALINRFIPGQIEIKKLDIRWGHGQRVEGIFLYDPKGYSVLEINKIFTEANLWQLIKGSTHLGYTQLQDLNASIITDETGISNLQSALGTPIKDYYRAIPPSTILLSNVNIDLELFTQGKPLAAYVAGLTRQEDLVGSFEIDASLAGLESKHWNELGHEAQKLLSIEGSKKAQIKAKIINFPVDLIDRLIALKKPEFNGIFRAILGDKLNLIADKEPSSQGLAFNLSLFSPLMQGDIKGQIAEGQFSFQEPGIFHFNLTPDLLNPFIQNRIKILEPTRLEFVFDELSFPLSFIESQAPVDPCKLILKSHAQIQPTKAEIFPLGEVNILEFQTILESPACAKNITLHVNGKVQQGTEPFNIHFDSTLIKPLTFKDLISQFKQHIESTLTIKHLPTELLSSYLETEPKLFKALIGSYLDLMLSINSVHNQSMILNANLQTENLVVNQAQFKIDKDINLLVPLTIEYRATPELNHLMELEPIKLKKSYPIIATVHKLKLPLPLSLTQLDKGQARIHLATPLIELTQQSSIESIQLQNIELKIDGHSLADLNAHLVAELSLMDSEQPYLSLIGEKAQLHLFSQFKFQEGFEIPQIQAKVDNQQVMIKLEGKMTSQHDFILTTPLEAKYQLNPSSFQALKIAIENQFFLKNSPWLHLKIDPFQFNLKKMNLALLELKGFLNIDRLDLQDETGNLARIDQIMIPWKINGPHNFIQFKLKGLAYANQTLKSSQLSARLSVEQWLNQGQYDLTHAKIETDASLMGLPISLVNSFIDKGDLTPLLGPSLDIELKTLIDRNQQAPGYWDMNIDSSHFHAKARLKFDQAITLYESINNAADIRWTLTPEGYQHLKHLLSQSSVEGMVLIEPMTFKGTITQLYLPLTKEAFLQKGKLDAELTTNEARWKDLIHSNLIQSFKIESSLHSHDLAHYLSFATTLTSNEASSVIFKGTVSDWMNQAGKASLKNANLNMELNAKHLPVTMVRSLLFLEQSSQSKLQAVIGDYLDTQARIELHQMDGTFLSQIQGDRGHAFLDGRVKQGILTLNKPLQWEIQVTPELSRTFLSESLPFFSSAFSADEPIKLIIDPQGFSIPLIPLELKKATIQKGKIELGKIHFYNKGDLKKILNILKPIPDEHLTIWFTPLYFQINQGKFIAKRLDMLISHEYPLAAWGEFDLNSRQLNMTLGLSEQSLKQAFNISGLDSTYLLQIPIQGREGHIQIDKAKATARISALIAQSQGSKEGKLLSTFLDFATSDNMNPHPPAATTQPFPWQNEREEIIDQQLPIDKDFDSKPVAEDRPKKHKVKKSNKSNPLKEMVEKEAGSLLNELLGR